MPLYNAMLQSIDCAEVKQYAGLHKTEFPAELIHTACKEAKLLSQAQATWEVYAYDSVTSTIQAKPAYKLEGASIQKHLAQAEKIIVLAATIGETIAEEISSQFREGNYAKALLLDAAATVAVETAADQLETALQPSFAKEGYRFKRRFSPGYGDWEILAQPHMLALSAAVRIGVSLTENYMLLPRKSITAVIGLTRTRDAAPESSCSSCQQTNCLARKENTEK